MNKQIPVMVTGIGGGGHGAEILKALRLAKTPYEIIGCDMSKYSKGLTEVDHPYLLPSATDPSYIETVLRVCKRHGVKVIFPGNEPELKALSKNRKIFEKENILLPINSQETIDLCMDKHQTHRWLLYHNFNTPRAMYVDSIDRLREVDFAPAILKPSIGGGGSNNVFLAQTTAELLFLGAFLLANIGPYIVQQYVGTPDDEFTVGVLCDLDGNFINSIAVKRMLLSGLSNRIKTANRTGEEHFGKILAISSGISQGEIGRFPEVTAPCEEIALKMGCRGAINLQCRYVDGKVYIFEINPRFSGTTYLRAMAGYNEPDLLIRKHLFGEKATPRFVYRSGIIVRGLVETFLEGPEVSYA